MYLPKRIIVLSIVFIGFTMSMESVKAQNQISERDIEDMVQRNVVPTIDKTEVTGSPYISKDFTSGYIESFSGGYADISYMNFNAYEQRIEYISGNQTYGIDPSNIREFKLKIGGEEKVFKKGYESKRLEGDEFVEVAAEGPLSFLIKHEVSYNENMASGYGSATKQASYSKNQRYFFKTGEEVSYERKLNKRRVMKYFRNDKEIKAYIEMNDLDLSDPKDVTQVVERYNSMTS